MRAVLTSRLLAGIPRIEHVFGTRHSPLSQDAMASLKQIHSARVLVADEAGGCVGEGDALITNRAGVPVSVRTADCLPILLVDPDRGAVAAIHAGWRGTAAHIVQEAVERMYAEFGSDPAGIHAAIGPGIGVCCYEVGAEVASQFGMEGAARIDLASENLRQLRQAGLLGASIDVLGLCTKCDATRFHSYRRDKESAGRMISYVRISGPL